MLSWMNRDGKILLLARIARGIGYGFLSVVLAIYLKLLGIDEIGIGIILTATLASSAAFAILTSILERRIGRKRLLVLFSSLMSLAGCILIISANYIVLLFAALIGTLNVTGTEVGPFLSLEQAIIPQTCDQKRRTLAFAVYGVGGTLATSAGALISGLPSLMQSKGLALLDSFKPLFGIYVLIGVTTLLLYTVLSDKIDSPPIQQSKQAGRSLLSSESRRVIARLSGLFALDSFGGGFVLQSFVSYWFYARFGASLEQISLIFFGTGVFTALSFLPAEKLAKRIGLVNTMVFTHLPSSVLLMLVPLAPNLAGAMAFYLGRMALSQMDVPTRQSYIVEMVRPEERVAAVSFTSISRNLSQATSPSFAGYLLQFLSLSSPFFIGGALKIAYDISLYMNFRTLKSPEESKRRPQEEITGF